MKRLHIAVGLLTVALGPFGAVSASGQQSIEARYPSLAESSPFLSPAYLQRMRLAEQRAQARANRTPPPVQAGPGLESRLKLHGILRDGETVYYTIVDYAGADGPVTAALKPGQTSAGGLTVVRATGETSVQVRLGSQIANLSIEPNPLVLAGSFEPRAPGSPRSGNQSTAAKPPPGHSVGPPQAPSRRRRVIARRGSVTAGATVNRGNRSTVATSPSGRTSVNTGSQNRNVSTQSVSISTFPSAGSSRNPGSEASNSGRSDADDDGNGKADRAKLIRVSRRRFNAN